MRLNSLDLTRYGKFTDLNLSFGRVDSGKPDLHVVYGANEAGKSTLFSGWLDLLFQVPVRSQMGFLHSNATLQLGAELEIAGRTHNLVRVKKRDHSLLDGQSNPVGEALLLGGLRGLDRASYSAMFSLNRHTLDEGGESILASEGDLGELLFQASAGLTDLATQLDTFRDQAMEFLNASGRKGRLKTLKAEFDQLGEQMKSLDTAATEYARLAKERDSARGSWHKAQKQAEAAQTKFIESDHLSQALPLAVRLRRIDSEISSFGELPDPPASWFAELPGLDRAETEMATRLDAAEKSVAELEAELAKLPQDNEILKANGDIAVTESLKSAFDQAMIDLPKRVKERNSESDQVRDSLARLGQSNADPDAVLPEVAVLGRLRGLVEQHSGIESRDVSAGLEQKRARAEAERAAQRLKKAGGSTADLGGLGGLVQNMRREDLVGSFDRAQVFVGEAQAVWHQRLAALAPWTGDDKAVESLIVPEHQSLERLAENMQTAAGIVEQERSTHQRLEVELAEREFRQLDIGATAVVSLEDMAKARAQREAKWASHRGHMVSETADHFEAAMRLDDQMMTTAADQNTKAGLAQEAKRALTEARRLTDASNKRLAKAEARQTELTNDLAAIVTGVSSLLPGDMAISAAQAWLAKFETAREALRKRNEAERKMLGCAQAIDRARSNLMSALSQAGRGMSETTDLSLALETAQSLLDQATQINALSEADAHAKHELMWREKAKSEAKTATRQWQSEWDRACAETWMADAPPNVPEMRAVLDELDQLRRHNDRATDLNRRIAAMQANCEQFKQAVYDLNAGLNMPSEGAPHQLWQSLVERLRKADIAHNKAADMQRRLISAHQKHADIVQKAAIHRTRTAEFGRFFGVASWQKTREALARAGDRAKLLESRRDCVEDICTRMGTATIEQALAALQDVDEAELQARGETLQTDLKTLRDAQDEALNRFRRAEDELTKVGGDDAVARLQEQRQTLLLEIEDGARQHLRRRLGLLAVDSALRKYRDTHRSGMLDRASEAFRAMSGGRYSGLVAQPDGAREVLVALVALAAQGGSKKADQLSDGTRAQLYLALRIAGYHEFTRNNGPVPFVADDIMESFDDDRAGETFALLAKMSLSGQVIYLTHHAHVCDIARKACPSVRIHQLPA